LSQAIRTGNRIEDVAMANHTNLFVASTLALLIIGSLRPAIAQSASPDARELEAYELSMPVLEKIAAANAAAQRTQAKDPRQQKLAKQKAELAALEAKDELSNAEHERLAVLADEIARADEGDQDDGANGAGTIAEYAARVESSPALAAAVKAVGLSPREYATAALALLHAATAQAFMDQKLLAKLPPEVSQRNLDFVRQHRARLEKLGVFPKGDG
jgi:hypothetical protein